MDRQDEFRARLLTTFRLEAADHLQAFTTGLLRLEQDPDDRGTIAVVYRAMHSLKGAASVVGYAGVTQICQALESCFSALQTGQARLSPETLELLHRAADGLRQLLENSDPAANDAGLSDLIRRVEQETLASPAATPGPPPAPPRPEPATEAAPLVRVSSERITDVLWHSEQLAAARAAGADLVDEISRIRALVLDARLKASARSRSRLRIELSNRESAGALASESEDDPLAVLLRELDPAIAVIERIALQNQRQLARRVTELVEAARSLSLSPAQNLLDAFPIVVRDLAHSLGKQVRVEIEGGDLELDRRILDHLRAPLLHLLRNAVGHGIEMPNQRAGKPVVGHICIAVRPAEDQRVEIEVSDDGAGIDAEQVARRALGNGMITADALQRMDAQQRLALVLLPGFSTRDEADRLSGRGLGLSIVQEKAEALGGSVLVESTPGKGASFRLRLPLRVATLRGVLVQCAGYSLVIPENSVHHVARIPVSQLRRHEGHMVIERDGRLLPLAGLAEMLQVAAPPLPADGFLQVVFLGVPAPRAILYVDAILREQEFILKQPLPPLQGLRWYLGMTVTGHGRVIPVLQPAELIRALVQNTETRPATLHTPGSETASSVPEAGRPLSILIAEDSITARIFLKNLLESQGHAVTCVGDGAEAWNALRRGAYDILLTDVEMPSLNGYALTERTRAEPRFAELPVVLITALDSPEHRRRGLAAGADAYLVKNQFDHEELLDTITRLVH